MVNVIVAQKNQLWEKAAQMIFDKLQKRISENKKTLLLLSGGSAINIYRQLTFKIPDLAVNSDNLSVGQIDERFQSADSDINAENIKSSGLIEALKIKGVPFYEIPQTGTLREAAFNYEKLLTKLFAQSDYKIAVLGIGADGHTAGILRSYRSEWDKQLNVIGYENRGEFPKRITVTPKVFRLFDWGIIAVSGIEKKEIVDRILKNESEDLNNLPGILIHKIKDTDLIRGF